MRKIPARRTHRLRVLAAPVAVVMAAGIALSGCGLQTGSAYVQKVQPASIEPIPALKGVNLAVVLQGLR